VCFGPPISGPNQNQNFNKIVEGMTMHQAAIAFERAEALPNREAWGLKQLFHFTHSAFVLVSDDRWLIHIGAAKASRIAGLSEAKFPEFLGLLDLAWERGSAWLMFEGTARITERGFSPIASGAP